MDKTETESSRRTELDLSGEKIVRIIPIFSTPLTEFLLDI